MNEEELRRQIEKGRNFLKNNEETDEDYQTDQKKHLPQPPLVKAPMRTEKIPLPRNFQDLKLINDTLTLFNGRASKRVYAGKTMTLLELSFLLWATQGVKSIRGKSYATLRTVPSGGARHAFECYFFARNVAEIKDGLYHYLPMDHAIECLKTANELSKPIQDLMSEAVDDQVWAAKANILFIYSFVPYRAEWRYGVYTYPVVLIDAGHVTENLYLACTAAGLGTCAIGAVNGSLCDELLELDGEEEFSFYAATAGTLDSKDQIHEDDIYAFVKEQGL